MIKVGNADTGKPRGARGCVVMIRILGVGPDLWHHNECDHGVGGKAG